MKPNGRYRGRARLISSGTKKGSPWNFRNIVADPELSKGEDTFVRASADSFRYDYKTSRQKLPCISRREQARYTLYADGYRPVLAWYSRRTVLSGNFYPARLPGGREKEMERAGWEREMELLRCFKRRSECEKEERRESARGGTRKSYTRSRWLSRVSSLDSPSRW